MEHGGRKIKARKVHKCAQCGNVIEPGEDYMSYKGKGPRYEGEEQIGIRYLDARICMSCEIHNNKLLAEDADYWWEHRYP